MLYGCPRVSYSVVLYLVIPSMNSTMEDTMTVYKLISRHVSILAILSPRLNKLLQPSYGQAAK